MLRKFGNDGVNFIPLTGNRYSFTIENGLIDLVTGEEVNWFYIDGVRFVTIDFGKGPEEWEYGVVIALATKRIRLPYFHWKKLTVLHVNGNFEDFHPGNLVIKHKELIEGPIPGHYYVPGYGYYCINSAGDLYSTVTRKYLSPYVDHYGYLIYGVQPDQGGRTICGMHRLLALTFIGYPAEVCSLDVNHIDGNKRNNNLSNLEWASRKRNCDHAYDKGLRDDNEPVEIRNIFTKESLTFRSISRAAEAVKTDAETLRRQLSENGQVLRLPGFQFRKKSVKSPWDELDNPTDAVHSVKQVKPVIVKDTLTGDVVEFKTISDASVYLEFSKETIRNSVKNSRALKNGRYIVYYPDFESIARSTFAEMRKMISPELLGHPVSCDTKADNES